MSTTKIKIVQPDAAGIAEAARLLKAEKLVAFPTETVYGLGADARSDLAVAAIFNAKGRPGFNPLIVHIADLRAAQKLADFSPLALRLAAAFWPGPLTLVLPRRDGAGISRHVSAGLPSLALRVPAHPVARALLLAFKGPVAAPSANPSGRLSPTEAEHIAGVLSGKVGLILDGGSCDGGLESTIVALTQSGSEPIAPRLLRPGGVTEEEISEVLGGQWSLSSPVSFQPKIHFSREQQSSPEAPGALASHYAPRAIIRLDQVQSKPNEMLLAFGPDAPKNVPGLNLSPTGDLAEAANNLFAYLHILDGTGVKIINVMTIPNHHLGVAINDRLRRAAAPRPQSAARTKE